MTERETRASFGLASGGFLISGSVAFRPTSGRLCRGSPCKPTPRYVFKEIGNATSTGVAPAAFGCIETNVREWGL